MWVQTGVDVNLASWDDSARHVSSHVAVVWELLGPTDVYEAQVAPILLVAYRILR